MKETFLKKISHARQRFREFRKSPHGRQVGRYASYLFQALVIGIILYQLTGIGWGKIYRALPTEPLYYLLFLFIYFLLPFSETLAYRICWGIPYLKSLSIFIKKRIFNKDVMGYSGEIVLMQWAVTEGELGRKQAFKDIRDMNIISSAASTIVALGLLGILVLSGKIRALDYLFSLDSESLSGLGFLEYLAGGAVLAILAGVAYRFRRYLFSMSLAISWKVFTIHTVRMILLYAAQILQWSVVLPDVSIEIWFTFLSVNIIMSRIPFLPSYELVATGTNIELAKIVKAPVAAVTGLFLVHDVLSKLLNLFFYLYYTFRDRPGNNEVEVK